MYALHKCLQAPCRLGPPTQQLSIKMPAGPLANLDREKRSRRNKKQKILKHGKRRLTNRKTLEFNLHLY